MKFLFINFSTACKCDQDGFNAPQPLKYLVQGCQTRTPLDKIVRPFLPLSSFTPFKGQANMVERTKKFLGGAGFRQV